MEFLKNIKKDINGISGISEGKYEENIQELKDLINKSKKDIEKVRERDKDLKIGIVGQVKAGKSSFLNALIFQGKNILPKASTPMTAALTKIKYSNKIKAEIEYYTLDDWKIVEKNAEKYNKELNRIKELKDQENPNIGSTLKKDIDYSQEISIEKRACKEIYTLYKKSGLSSEIFGRIESLDGVLSIDELLGKLSNYVGADGKYTPVVKSCTLYVNDENLKGIEIIDTPGTNDPIVSRGRVTRNYLANCDLIFMLSYSGQFLGREDVDFLLRILPNEGIASGTLVASKFDSVLLDVRPNGKGIEEIYSVTARKLNKQAAKSFNDILEIDPNNKLAKELKNNLPPSFISAMAFNIHKNFDNLNSEKYKEEKHIYTQLERRFKIDKNTLSALSGLDKVKNEKLECAKVNKEKIMNDKMKNLIFGKTKQYIENLSSFKEEVKYDIDILANKDIVEIERNYNNIIKKLNDMKDYLDIEFSNISYNVEKKFQRLKKRLKEEKDNEKYLDYDVMSSTREVYSETTGSLWWKKDHYKTEKYFYVNVKNAVDKSAEFLEKIEDVSIDLLGKIFSKEEITNKIKKIIIEKIYNDNDIVFEAKDLELPLTKTLNKLNIPELIIKKDFYTQKIDSTFSNLSNIEGEKIYDLKSSQKKLQREILDSFLNKELKEYGTETLEKLNSLYNQIVDNFKHKLELDLNRLKQEKTDFNKNLSINNKILGMLNKMLDNAKGE